MKFTAIFEPILGAMMIHCENSPNYQGPADAEQRHFWKAIAEEVAALDGPAIIIEQCEVLARVGFLPAPKP